MAKKRSPRTSWYELPCPLCNRVILVEKCKGDESLEGLSYGGPDIPVFCRGAKCGAQLQLLFNIPAHGGPTLMTVQQWNDFRSHQRPAAIRLNTNTIQEPPRELRDIGLRQFVKPV